MTTDPATVVDDPPHDGQERPDPAAETAPGRPRDNRRRDWLAAGGYLVAAVVVTFRLWQHPAGVMLRENRQDQIQFEWFLTNSVHTLRQLPHLGVRFLRVALELVITAIAIAWLSPTAAGIALVAALAAAGIPLLGQPVVAERDLRVRTHTGALARFHLDALLGRTAIQAHGAATTIEREHEGLLAEWTGAFHSLQRASVVVEGIQMLVGFGLVSDPAIYARSLGTNVNLWWGLVLLAFGLGMLVPSIRPKRPSSREN